MSEQAPVEKKVPVKVFATTPRGRYRAGTYWPHEWVTSLVTKDQLAQLKGDPVLNVAVLTNDDKAEASALPKAKDKQPGKTAQAGKPKNGKPAQVVPWAGSDNPAANKLQKLQDKVVAQLDDETQRKAREAKQRELEAKAEAEAR